MLYKIRKKNMSQDINTTEGIIINIIININRLNSTSTGIFNMENILNIW